EQTIEEFFDLGARLHELDRFHRHRRAHLTGPFRIDETVVAPRALVSAAAVPFRAHRGLYVVVEEPRDSDAFAQHEREMLAEHDRALVEVPGVAGVWTFATPA